MSGKKQWYMAQMLYIKIVNNAMGIVKYKNTPEGIEIQGKAENTKNKYNQYILLMLFHK